MTLLIRLIIVFTRAQQRPLLVGVCNYKQIRHHAFGVTTLVVPLRLVDKTRLKLTIVRAQSLIYIYCTYSV